MSILQFSEHLQLLFDNSNVNNDKQIKQTMAIFFSANFSELSNFSFSSSWGKPLWNQKLLLLTATARSSCYTLVRLIPTLTFCHFSHTFLELIIATKIKTMCQKKNCVYYMSEHLKYCAQINEYWFNKYACLNIV